MITIETPSRIHITLIDMNGSQGRLDGSVGIALTYPLYKIQFSKSNRVEIKGCDTRLENKINNYIELFYQNYKKLPGLSLEVLEKIPSHRGLGSGTQLALSIAAAFNLLYKLELSTHQLSKIMQRGGTSSLGTYFFERGGFVIEGGHSIKDKKEFLPSRFAKDVPIAPLLFQYQVPYNWKVVLCYPNEEGLSGISEKEFMKSVCPIDEYEVEKSCRVILMKLMPAILEERFEDFCDGISYLQDNGWKKYHWQRPHNHKYLIIKKIMETIGLKGVGLSSTGSTVFGFYDSNIETIENIKRSYEEQIKINNISYNNYSFIFTEVNLKGSNFL